MSCRCLLYSYSSFWGTVFLALQWVMALPCSWPILLMYWARAVMLRCVWCSASASSQIVCHSWCKVSTHPLLVRNFVLFKAFPGQYTLHRRKGTLSCFIYFIARFGLSIIAWGTDRRICSLNWPAPWLGKELRNRRMRWLSLCCQQAFPLRASVCGCWHPL